MVKYIENFNCLTPATVVTGWGDIEILYGRNPYGSHNLIVAQDGKAIRHGNCQAVFVLNWAITPKKRKRRLIQFCIRKKINFSVNTALSLGNGREKSISSLRSRLQAAARKKMIENHPSPLARIRRVVRDS